MTMTVPELLDHLRVAQEHDPMLGKYWILARSIHTNYNIVYNLIGKFLTFKGGLYVPKKMVPTMFYEYHDANGYFG